MARLLRRFSKDKDELPLWAQPAPPLCSPANGSSIYRRLPAPRQRQRDRANRENVAPTCNGTQQRLNRDHRDLKTLRSRYEARRDAILQTLQSEKTNEIQVYRTAFMKCKDIVSHCKDERKIRRCISHSLARRRGLGQLAIQVPTATQDASAARAEYRGFLTRVSLSPRHPGHWLGDSPSPQAQSKSQSTQTTWSFPV
mmetsp:Transcript_6160/g.13511  ORF Transcript_6160/g.13511 Transcript_6160/m.13511 type:complete len:198 (-) Transcript_6160:27-620(-)